MEIIFKKGNTKNTLTCRRSDGSTTWTEVDSFMVVHDLTHFAVETELNLENGFYGLLASGMDITDFEDKQKFKPKEMPAESLHTEMLVNLLLTEISDGTLLPDFNDSLREVLNKFSYPAFTVPENKLQTVRVQIKDLINQWNGLGFGEALSFRFKAKN